MVKMEPITPQSSKNEVLEYVEEYYSDYEYLSESYFLEWFEFIQSEELRKSFLEEYFNGDWRLGQEVHKVVITQRLYQTSPNSTQE